MQIPIRMVNVNFKKSATAAKQSKFSETKTTNRRVAAQRYYVHKSCFQENRKDTKVVRPVVWTYNICAFDASIYYDHY